MSKQLAIQARDALRIAEWVCYEDPDNGTQIFCPVCCNAKQHGHYEDCQLEASIAALQAAIDAPDAEPVAWMHPSGGVLRHPATGLERSTHTIPLYLHPPAAREPLTEAEIIELAKDNLAADPGRDGYILPIKFAHAIEAAVRAKP